MTLSIVIVSYNVRHYLEQCLTSVFASPVSGGAEVWVVDNASSDGSLDYLRPRFPQVHYIQNHDNVGFSRANNQAIRQCAGRYVLLLNPDTVITEHTLQDCVDFMDSHPAAGCTGVAMYGHDGRFAWESRRGLPTPWTALCKMTGLTALFPHSRVFGRYYMRYLPRLRPARIEVVSGAFCMLRRTALDEVGLLDEDFFMYGEDIDLSCRMLRGGWENWYLPTPILHYKGESTQKSSYRYVHIFYGAMLIFFRKHYPRRRFLAALVTAAVWSCAALNMLGRAAARLLRRHPEPRILVMDDYQVRDYPERTFASIIEERVTLYARGDRHSIGIRHTATGITVLPYDILTNQI